MFPISADRIRTDLNGDVVLEPVKILGFGHSTQRSGILHPVAIVMDEATSILTTLKLSELKVKHDP